MGMIESTRRGSLFAGTTLGAIALFVAASAPNALASRMGTHVDMLASDDGISKPDYYRYLDAAYPAMGISPAQSEAARAAFAAIVQEGGSSGRGWTEASYQKAYVPAPVTYTGLPFTASGRTTALALTPGCSTPGSTSCRAILGAAGGGIWIAANPFEGSPQWQLSSSGLRSNAIGSIAVDPNADGKIIYAGTGEQNSSGDSEAGVGLYKSTDGGANWTVVGASVGDARGLSVSSIVIDPRDSSHLYFGTATAVHGAAASAGASLPPGTRPAGVFESHDGGAHFTRIYTNGPGAFTGSVMQMALDPSDPDTLYVSALGIGLLRSSMKLDGDTAFHIVYVSKSPIGTPEDGYNRSAFALAKTPQTTRIYLGDSIDADGNSYLYRVDNSRVPASTLSDGTNDAGWLALTSSTPGTPGFSSFDFCEGQCFYDIWVASPPGRPEQVYYGGSMQYDEIFTANPPSNGRAVMRSTDLGVSFTDMTRDTRSPNSGGMHPDQHAVLFNPLRPEQILAASDGGMVRTSGRFADATPQCDNRGLTGTDLTDCRIWLKAIPTIVAPINQGLETLQFQDVEFDPSSPETKFIGGTQDNGTWLGTAGSPLLVETVGGDGGLSGYDAAQPNIKFHTYYGTSMDVNFTPDRTTGWNYVSDPLAASGESTEFYMAAINDPVVGGTIFAGMQHVWRTQDSGGPRAYLQQHCNEYFGDFTTTCGDFVALGQDLTGTAFGTDLTGGELAIMTRWTGDQGTMWAATNKGRLFVSSNVNAADPAAVTFTRIDNAASPHRVVSGIAPDLSDSTHAYVAYTGYGAYTPSTPGHVFDVHAPAGSSATFTDISYNLHDMPITALVRDSVTGDLYAASDFGVLVLKSGTQNWTRAGHTLPYVAVYQLKLTASGLLYAATHGRGIWTLATH